MFDSHKFLRWVVFNIYWRTKNIQDIFFDNNKNIQDIDCHFQYDFFFRSLRSNSLMNICLRNWNFLQFEMSNICARVLYLIKNMKAMPSPGKEPEGGPL
jgi:hypothetical protein